MSLAVILQLVIALGLLNVWLLRVGSATAYRGGDAQDLKSEFAVYGLPAWAFYAVGALKIGAAIALGAGVFVPGLTRPAAMLIMALMLGAVSMHLKVRDPLLKAVPASLMLAMSVAVVALG